MNPQKFILFTFFCISIILLVWGVAFYPQYSPIVYNQLKEWKLVPLPEPLTELFFEDHLLLPAKIVAGDDLSFRFTIHNVEYKPVSYPYTIYFQDGQQRVATQGSLFLKQDESVTVPIVLTDPNIATRTAVVVSLDNRQERIHFWVEPR